MELAGQASFKEMTATENWKLFKESGGLPIHVHSTFNSPSRIYGKLENIKGRHIYWLSLANYM